MDPPMTDLGVSPEKFEEVKEASPLFRCDLFDSEVVHKIAQVLLLGLSTACVDNTTGDLFKGPALVAVDIKKEMVDYLTQRSETFVAESVVQEGGPDAETSDHPTDIVSDFVDDFTSSKRNLFGRVSGWLLSERREDKIDDFVQEMELSKFWLVDRREAIAQTLLKNIDFKSAYNCDKKFHTAEELDEHKKHCIFRSVICESEGCSSTFCALHKEKHDALCTFKVLPCEQGCEESIMRHEMDRHCITVCPMKLINCPFYSVGCQSTAPVCKIDLHLSEFLHSHIQSILQTIHKEATAEDLKYRIEQLEKSSSLSPLSEIRAVRTLTLAVKVRDAKLGPLEHVSIEVSKENSETSNKVDEERPETHIKGSEGSPKTSSAVTGESPKTPNKVSEESPKTSNIVSRESPKTPNKVSEESPKTTNEVNEESPKTSSKATEESPKTSNIVSRESPMTPDKVTEESPKTTNKVDEESRKTPSKPSEESPKTSNIVSGESRKTPDKVSEESPKTTKKVDEESPKTPSIATEDSPKTPLNKVDKESPKTPSSNSSEESPKTPNKFSEEIPKIPNRVNEESPKTPSKASEESPKSPGKVSKEESPKTPSSKSSEESPKTVTLSTNVSEESENQA